MEVLNAERLNDYVEDDAGQMGEALERVITSRTFRRASRLRDLLSYVVHAAASGRSTDERRTAMELFGKTANFDPTLDPIIRVHFGRLRRYLTRYYNSEGQHDPVVIEIPSRSYTPTFHFRNYGQGSNGSSNSKTNGPNGLLEHAETPGDHDQCIAVLPFANLTQDPKQDAFCYGLTEEITTALAAIPSLNVLVSSATVQFRDDHFDVREVGRDLGVSLILEGSVRMERGQTRVTAQLARSEDGVAIWSDSFDGKVNGALNTQRALARRILGSLPLKNSDSQADPGVSPPVGKNFPPDTFQDGR